jgi:hypothetical protein
MKMPGEDPIHIPARAIAGKVLSKGQMWAGADLPAHMVFNGRDHVCPLALPAVLAGCLARAAGIDRSRNFARLARGREQHHRVRHCDRKQVEREE